MRPYRVEFRPEATDDLDHLDPEACRRVLNRIRWLAAHFEEVTLYRRAEGSSAGY